MPPIFRIPPPLDLVELIIRTTGLHSLTDSQWFTKQQINLQSFEELLPELEPYYIPCKANIYIYNNPFTPAHAITIIRQVLKVHSHTLKASEKTRIGEKTVWYQIVPTIKGISTENNLKEDIIVSFN